MKKSLTREERLKNESDFSLVFENVDVRSTCRGGKLVARFNGREMNRFAVTTVRKFGNSVQRNYARRVLKEIYRNIKEDLFRGYDIIIVLYSGDYNYHEREQQFMKLIRRAGIVKVDN